MTAVTAPDLVAIPDPIPVDVIYHGIQPVNGGPGLIHIETERCEILGVVPHIYKHSRGGYAWGYAGSGPADCARSLLITAIGPAAECGCGGNPRCERVCDTGYKQLPYQMFKHAVLANAPDEFRLARPWVLTWLNRAENCITMRTVQFGADGWPKP